MENRLNKYKSAMNNDTITFDQIPGTIKQLVDEVKSLREKIDKISENTDQRKGQDTHRVLYVDEVCKMIRKSRNTLYAMTSKGIIPSYKQGKYLYFFEDEILEWIKTSRKNVNVRIN